MYIVYQTLCQEERAPCYIIMLKHNDMFHENNTIFKNGSSQLKVYHLKQWIIQNVKYYNIIVMNNAYLKIRLTKFYLREDII
jgi:hypothetical protein